MEEITRRSAFLGSVTSTANQRLMTWFRTKRLQKKLTMRELGNRLHIPHSYISKIEHCERRLDVVEFARYCRALEVDPREAMEVLLATTV